jgi:hypothetical protein
MTIYVWVCREKELFDVRRRKAVYFCSAVERMTMHVWGSRKIVISYAEEEGCVFDFSAAAAAEGGVGGITGVGMEWFDTQRRKAVYFISVPQPPLIASGG